MTNVLAIDLGNVIIDHKSFGTTPEYVLSGDYRAIPEVPDSISVISQLAHGPFHSRVHVMYNASTVANEKIQEWLRHHEFSSRTGISSEKIHRSEHGRDKSALCLCHNVTHFIDDRLEVLGMLVKTVNNLFLLNAHEEEVSAFRRHLPYVIKLSTWLEIERALNKSAQ